MKRFVITYLFASFLILMSSCDKPNDKTDDLPSSGECAEADKTKYFKDEDEDGFGNADVSKLACSKPDDYVEDNTDTDDTDAKVFPGCQEIKLYRDADADGYGDAEDSVSSCTDVDGYVTDNTDPNDSNDEVYPNCEEIALYRDADEDGYGNPQDTLNSCTAVDGYVEDNTDQNDNNNLIYPGCTETVYYLDYDEDGYGDGGEYIGSCVEIMGYVDNDWDLDDSDENVGCQETTYYRDKDLDGYGDPEDSMMDCTDGDAPAGYVEDNTDCDDSNAGLNPGIVYLYALDVDHDGYAGNQFSVYVSVCGTPPDGTVPVDLGYDCNDLISTINPGAIDIPNNGIDENCNGVDGS